jgi:hypothetical protein
MYPKTPCLPLHLLEVGIEHQVDPWVVQEGLETGLCTFTQRREDLAETAAVRGELAVQEDEMPPMGAATLHQEDPSAHLRQIEGSGESAEASTDDGHVRLLGLHGKRIRRAT